MNASIQQFGEKVMEEMKLIGSIRCRDPQKKSVTLEMPDRGTNLQNCGGITQALQWIINKHHSAKNRNCPEFLRKERLTRMGSFQGYGDKVMDVQQ